MRALVRDLSLALREQVLPVARLARRPRSRGRRRGRRRRRDLRDRRRGRGHARELPRRARARRRLLLRGPRPGGARPARRARCWWSTRSTAPARPWPGSSPAACRWPPRRSTASRRWATCRVACVVEIPSGTVFLAERGAGLVEGPPVRLSRQRADRPDVLDLRLPRPARPRAHRGAGRADRRFVGRRRHVRPRLGGLRHDARGHRASSTPTSSRARGWSPTCPGCARSSRRVGGGAVLNNSPYDLAAAALVLRGGGSGRDRRVRRAARRPAAAGLGRSSSRCRWSPPPTRRCTSDPGRDR